MPSLAEIEAWADRISQGDSRALARALTEIENRGSESQPLLAALFQHAKPAWRIGVTGAPGSGKSTLVNALAQKFSAQGRRVAVLAVDPSSPFTGGAVLGDRVRMSDRDSDSDVFIRSMAARGSLGGLSATAADVVTALEASGRDVVLIETVGVGQAEVDVVGLAETVALVLTPNMGDGVQALKAGVMEIAQVFALNKCDLPGADRAEQQLESALSLRPADGSSPTIVRTTAEQGQGIDDLITALEQRRSGPQALERYWQDRISAGLSQGISSLLIPRLAPPAQLEQAAQGALSGETNPYAFVAETLAPFADHAPRLDHLGVAVRSIDQAVGAYQAFGFEASPRIRVEHENVEVVMLPAGDARIELLEPTSSESTIARFIERRGEGLHHVAVRVPDLDQAVAAARAKGLRLIHDQPQVGAENYRYVFVHPKSVGGVLLELIGDLEPPGTLD